jgi:CBS domain-containing protein
MQVREAMSEEVKIVSPDDTIQQAAKLMEQVDCGAIPVREKDRLVGVVTDRDIAIRAVATGARPDQCKVREVMSPGIKYVFEDETAESAAERMSEFQIRRLPVLNREKHLVGIVSLGDLALRERAPAARALEGVSKPNGTALDA